MPHALAQGVLHRQVADRRPGREPYGVGRRTQDGGSPLPAATATIGTCPGRSLRPRLGRCACWSATTPSTCSCDHARRAADGRGSVVLVAGEAGIGKTVLLREFAERAPVPVLWGMCDSLSTPRPLGPLRDVAGDLARP